MEISQRLVSAEPDSVSAHVAEIRRFVSEQLGNIHQLLNADVQRAKAELAKHVTAIQMQRQGEGKKGHYIAIGEWNILGGYAGRLPSQEGAKKRVRMVAGPVLKPFITPLEPGS